MVIRDILEEHVEELHFLWGLRFDALESSRWTWPGLLALEDRIESHVQGLLVAGREAIPILEEGLRTDEPAPALAAAHGLLVLDRDRSARIVLDAFLRAEGGRLEGLRRALSYGPVVPVLPRLRQALESGPPTIAAAAAEVLAFQSRPNCSVECVDQFLYHESPEVRRAGWRVLALLKAPAEPRRYDEAFGDDDPRVRGAALWAAAWARQPWLVDRCRALARSHASGCLDALRFLAILGRPEDLGTIRDPVWAGRLGASWFEVLGSSGHPAVVSELIRGMEGPDPRLAVAAGAAFTRITGREVASTTRVRLSPEDGHEPDAFEEEFLDEEFLPDPTKARELWEKLENRRFEDRRWCRGRELGPESTRDVFDGLDLQSRREAIIRAHFETEWDLGLIELERFPQRLPGLFFDQESRVV